MTFQFDPIERRIVVCADDKEFRCLPETLINLDSDLGDAAKRAMSNPGLRIMLNVHQKRSSMTALAAMRRAIA